MTSGNALQTQQLNIPSHDQTANVRTNYSTVVCHSIFTPLHHSVLHIHFGGQSTFTPHCGSVMTSPTKSIAIDFVGLFIFTHSYHSVLMQPTKSIAIDFVGQFNFHASLSLSLYTADKADRDRLCCSPCGFA